MKISDILERFGWKKSTSDGRGIYFSKATVYKHPSKKMEFLVQSKELWVNGKMTAKFSLSRTQDEVVIDEANGLMIIGNDIAVHVG